MSGFEMFCERCGKRYGNEETTAAGPLPLGRRLLMAVGVGVTAPAPVHQEPVLRFCLACRGYSCPACWNEDAGFCQTCVPLPETEPVAAEPHFAGVPQLVFEAIPTPLPNPLPWASLAEPVVEPVAEAEEVAAEPVFEAVALETWLPEHAAFDLAEVEPEPVVAEPEPVFDEPEPILAEPELEAKPVIAEAGYAEDTSYTEPEPDVQWDLSLDLSPEADAEPEGIAEPEPVLTFEPAMPEGPALPEALTVREAPALPMAPIFRPLEPMGPLMPPLPPPAAAQAPRIEFDLPDPPPAFLMARPTLTPALRPTLPVGLFDGPGPAVKPCPHCELPVSAKARFCRRCGSAQS